MTHLRNHGAWMLVLVVGASGCAGHGGKDAVISGNAYCPECIEAPPDAAFDAILEDISRADVAATELGRAHLEPIGKPPFRFEIAYDPNAIDTRHSYAVRARVTRAGQLLFVSDSVYPVLTGGAGDVVNIQLHRTPGASAKPRSQVSLGQLPAVFVGTLPCADCSGISYELTLRDDASYSLHTRYEGRSIDQQVTGRWVYSEADRTLRLEGTNGSTEAFHVTSPDRIDKLDQSGQPIISKLNYAQLRSQ
jgi:copper homeostasis protein (lipoprotein)